MGLNKFKFIIYRRSWWIRFFQYQQFVLSLIAIIALMILGIIFIGYQTYLPALIFVTIALGLIWFLRPSYFVAHANKLIVSDTGIQYHYLGISGFAVWDDMLIFDEDSERAWLNFAYHSSDLRHLRLQLGFFSANFPLRYPSIFGIRLNHTPALRKSFLANLPKQNLDFIPLSVITDIPRFKDNSVNLARFSKTALGQDLLEFVPHLFDIEKPKNHPEKAYEDDASWQSSSENNAMEYQDGKQ